MNKLDILKQRILFDIEINCGDNKIDKAKREMSKKYLQDIEEIKEMNDGN